MKQLFCTCQRALDDALKAHPWVLLTPTARHTLLLDAVECCDYNHNERGHNALFKANEDNIALSRGGLEVTSQGPPVPGSCLIRAVRLRGRLTNGTVFMADGNLVVAIVCPHSNFFPCNNLHPGGQLRIRPTRCCGMTMPPYF